MLSILQSNFPELYEQEQTEHEASAREKEQALEAQAATVEVELQKPHPSCNVSLKQQLHQQQLHLEQQHNVGAVMEDVQGEEEDEDQQEPDQYQQKVESIKAKFTAKQISADELELYLKTATEEAKAAEAQALAEADQEYTPAWQHVGLPMKPSHLHLDANTMKQGGLVNPKAIMQQFHQVRAKEVHNPPRTYEYNDARIQPNYLNPTANMTSRKKTLLPPDKAERVRTMYLTERKWPHLSEEEVTKHIAESEERRRVQDLRMPAAQYELEKKLIASMNHKLAFLRNPRHPDPPSVKMLKSQFENGQTWGVSGKGADGLRTTKFKPPIKYDLTSRPEQVFLVEPEKVLFTDYEVGQVYRRVVKVRNVTSVIRNLRLLPPASQYFHMSMLSFPMDNGCIAPGMAAEVTLRFTPDSLADYDDVMVVDTAAHRFPVELQARRLPPMLTLEQGLSVGEVVCGNRKVKQFRFTNEGGHARFKVVPESYWPLGYADAPEDLAQAGAFQVWPLHFDLANGEEVGLNIAFEPDTVGEHRERLIMVCNNCQVKDIVVHGLASDVDIRLEAIDGVPLKDLPLLPPPSSNLEGGSPGQVASSHSGPHHQGGTYAHHGTWKSKQSAGSSVLDMPLWFGEVVPGSGFSRRLSVRNTTLLAFPFKWSFSSHPETRESKPSHDHLNSSFQALMTGEQHDAAPVAGADVLALADMKSSYGVSMSTRGQQKGHLDLVKLGLEEEMGFKVQPQEGVLQPGELAEFYFTFEPPELKRYLYWAQLKVDKSAVGQAPSGCNLCVLEAGLEGLAAPLLLELVPRVYKVPGTLTPGCTHTRPITLRNPSRAPAHYSFHYSEHSEVHLLSVQPSSGVVPPASSSTLLLTFSAPPFSTIHKESSQPRKSQLESSGVHRQLGGHQLSVSRTGPPGMSGASGVDNAPHTWAFEEEVVCHVRHGGALPLVLAALVAEPRVELVTTRLDFGLLRLGANQTRTLRLKNASATCGASWSLEEMVTKEGGVPSQMVDSMKQANTHLGFLPSTGLLRPGEYADVQVTCFGQADGQHHSIVKLTSPSSGALECLEAFAVVVTPRLVVSTPKVDLGITFLGVTAKFSVKLRNLALLPVEYSWVVEGRTVSRQQDAEDAAATMTANLLLGRSVGGAQLATAFQGMQADTDMLEFDGAEDDEGEGLPAEMKIRPEIGILDPGQEVEVKMRFTPRTTGPITLYGVCDLVGAPMPCGFAVTSVTRGLDVMYELLTQDQLAAWAAARARPKALKRKDDVDHFVGMTHLPKDVLTKLGACRMAQRTHPQPPRFQTSQVANYGDAVPLGEARHMYLVITNCTAIATSVHTKLDNFGVQDVGLLTGSKDQGSAHSTLGLPSYFNPSLQVTQALSLNNVPPLHPNPTRGVRELRQLAAMGTGGASVGHKGSALQQDGQPGAPAAMKSLPRFSAAGGGTHVGSPNPRLSHAGSGRFSIGDFAGGQGVPRHAPIKLDGQTGKLAPFRSPVGNEMMATRRLQEESSGVLGSKGLAIHVSPPSCLLGPWSRTVLQLSCFNDMCGDYHDTLHVQVGSLPKKEVAVRVGVSGTPLVVQQERVLIAGLKGRQWRTQLPMGALPVGVALQKTFYVFNTGGLDMHLDWTFLRYQDDSDCTRPEAKIFNVSLEPCIIHPPPITDEDQAAAKAAMEAAAAEEEAELAAAEAAADEAAAMAEAMAAAARKKGKGAGAKPGAEVKGSTRGGAGSARKGGVKGGKEGPGALTKGGKGNTSMTRPSTSNTDRSDGPEEGVDKEEEEAKKRARQAKAISEAVRKRHPLPKSFLLAEEGPYEGIRLSLSPNAAEDVAPYTVEPRQAVIKGGGHAKFTVRFTSDRAAHHSGYLHGIQRVFSPEVPLSLKTWPAGEGGEGVGVMLSGTFHPYAGQPPAPLQPLRVDLSATSLKSHLEPDANNELEFVCCSTQPPAHPAYKHVVTLTNLQSCPLMFSLATEGPFQLVSASPSVPQDPAMFRGTTGLMQQPHTLPGMMPAPPTWAADQMYLPPQGSVDTTIQFTPEKVDHHEDYELSGHLVVRYSNGDAQQLPLTGRIQHPALQLSHAQQLPRNVASLLLSKPAQREWSAPLVFGQVHMQSPKSIEVILSNTTLVDAVWAVASSGDTPQYLPVPPSDKGKLMAAPRTSESEPAPRSAATSGVIPPPFRGTSAPGLGSTTHMSGIEIQGPVSERQDLKCTLPRAAPQWAVNEAKFGAFSIWPAAGSLPGRGLHLPRTQAITITFSPPDNKEHRQLVVFGCSKGRPVALELVGTGSYDETEEHQRVLHQI